MAESACWIAGLAGVFLLGCSGAGDTVDQPDPGGAASTRGAAGCPTTNDAAQGSGTVSGAVQGAFFATVSNSLWIGMPDRDATTVVFLFSKPVVCSALCAPGWDTLIADGTEILEIKALGVNPGTFPVVKTATPAAGEAVVNSTLSSINATPAETIGSAGTVTLALLTSQQTATGAFDLQFASDSLSGSFNSAYCPEGHEP